MEIRHNRSFVLIGATAVWLGAGANPHPAMQARLELGAPSCAAAADLAAASAFAQQKGDVYSQTVRFTEASPCLTDAAGKKTVYAVMALPPGDASGIVTVTSYAMGETIFSPRLQMRDEHGAVTREVGRDAFLFSGAAIETQLRGRPGERYLVIMSDNASVGKTLEQIQSSRISTGAMVGPIFVPVNTGSEATSKVVFAYNGEVTVTVAPMPKADGR